VTPLSLYAERFGLRSGVSQSGVGAAALQTGGDEGPRNERKPAKREKGTLLIRRDKGSGVFYDEKR